MTRQELESRYQLVEQVTHGDVRTHHAVAGGGTVVMVHFVRPDTARGQAALEAVDALEGAEAEKVLRVHEVEGEKVLVTRFLMDEGSLAKWLGLEEVEDDGEPDEATRLFKATRPGEDQESDAGGDDEPGEFTKLFKAQQVPDDPPPPEPPSPPSSEPDPPSDPSGDADGEPGEFTRLFKAIRPGPEAPASPDAAGPPTPPPPPPPPTPPAPDVQEPEAPAAEGPPPSPPEPESPAAENPPSSPGSFTQEFGRVERPGEGESAPPRPAETPPPPPSSSGPGLSYTDPDRGSDGSDKKSGPGSASDDYLDRLRSPGGPGGTSGKGETPPSPPPPPGSAGATPGSTSAGGGDAPPPPPRSGQGGSGGRGSAGPSEFTRVIAAASKPGMPSAPRKPSAPRPPSVRPPPTPGFRSGGGGRGPSTLLLVVGMAVIFLLALGVVLFLALSDGGEENGADEPTDEAGAEETARSMPGLHEHPLYSFNPPAPGG